MCCLTSVFDEVLSFKDKAASVLEAVVPHASAEDMGVLQILMNWGSYGIFSIYFVFSFFQCSLYISASQFVRKNCNIGEQIWN